MLFERAKAYEQALCPYRSILSVKHGKGFKRRLEQALANDVGLNHGSFIQAVLAEVCSEPKSANIVGKVHRAAVRYYLAADVDKMPLDYMSD